MLIGASKPFEKTYFTHVRRQLVFQALVDRVLLYKRKYSTQLSRYAVNTMMMQTALLGINTVRMSNRILHQIAPERNKRRNNTEKQLRFQRHYWRMLSAASCLSVRHSKSQVRQSS